MTRLMSQKATTTILNQITEAISLAKLRITGMIITKINRITISITTVTILIFVIITMAVIKKVTIRIQILHRLWNIKISYAQSIQTTIQIHRIRIQTKLIRMNRLLQMTEMVLHTVINFKFCLLQVAKSLTQQIIAKSYILKVIRKYKERIYRTTLYNVSLLLSILDIMSCKAKGVRIIRKVVYRSEEKDS